MKKISLLFLAVIFQLLIGSSLSAQEKRALSHDDYDIWNDLKAQQISPSGEWVSYEVNPQEGDGNLWLYHSIEEDFRSFHRAYGSKFAPNESFIAFKVKAQADTTRKAKLDGKKKDKLPKDSLGIYVFQADSLHMIPDLVSFKVPTEGESWIAYLIKEAKEVKDTTAVSDSTSINEEETEEKPAKKDKKKTKQEGDQLVVFNAADEQESNYKNVKEYSFSKNGKLLGFISTRKDSIDSVFVHMMVYPGIQSQLIYEGPGYAKKITCDEQGQQLAYLFSADTGKVKVYDLWMWDVNNNKLTQAVDAENAAMPEDWCISEHGNLFFSENGKRLFFGTASIPEEEVKDTLTDDEKVSVDIWNWKDDRLQPMQIKQLDKDKKTSYLAVYFIPLGRMVQLADEAVNRIQMNKKHNGSLALGLSYKPYYKQMSWDADGRQDAYLINVDNGEQQKVLTGTQSTVTLSPLGRYIIYYDELDSSWNSWSVKSGEFKNLTDEIPICFSREEFDMPTDPGPYGIMGWTKNDERLLVYDRFDVWMLDPKGEKDAVNLTQGRANEQQFRYVKLDRDEEYISEKENLLLYAFNENTKQSGFYNLNISGGPELHKIFMDDYRFLNPAKAKEADKLIWKKMSFSEYPNLHISNLDFSGEKVISDANPQQDEYLWGSVELVDWISADGIPLEGLLYKPDNFDPDSSYPMIIYFYEKYSNSLHSHYTPKPSRSTVNFSYYASNGYIVFVPNIVYKTGFPGQSAYNAIVSGTIHLMQNPWVDAEHIGIQGQSWGGYQVAYLVTQTNIYAAAMAGAPVSNMTSAYGGIRWGSGMSRMFQYEETQSRIGGTLWEKPWRYIENSPVFFADKVETPLLIMHNDKDGAVPWYQGIELFVALRRLNKPAWMLTYNGAPHNLKRRADSKDLSIRMQQFFDHYLKGAPAPVWMEYGVPAIDKGMDMGYELVKP